MEKSAYQQQIVPDIQRLKFDFTGHDQIVLHERDIRRQSGAFAFLQVDDNVRAAFLDRVNDLVDASPSQVMATVVDKTRLKERYVAPWSPYDIALHLCMERILEYLLERNQADRLVHVVFESRGAREDAELELRFRRIANNEGQWDIAR